MLGPGDPAGRVQPLRPGYREKLLAELFAAAREAGSGTGWALTDLDNTVVRRLFPNLGGLEDDSDLVLFEFSLSR